MLKIPMPNPIVEMDGDEMTRVLWAMVKGELIEPFVSLNTEYYDLGLPKRDATDDRVTAEAGEAIRRLRVGVKCATITPNAQRVDEYKLKRMWKSPNATIRAILDGTVFREPIVAKCVRPAVRSWVAPITIARHAYGDVYKAVELRVQEAGLAELVFTGASGASWREAVHRFEGPGVLQGAHNTDASIESFARSCFSYALAKRQDLWFATKDTISKQYDQAFKDIFQGMFDAEFKEPFSRAGIEYFYTLIDDAVARVIRSKGGFVWACKNYDGDVMSDLVSTAFGSLAMMTSVLASPDGCYEYEASHGTVTKHYYRHVRGEETSTNPIATIFAWSGALRKRGELDGAPGLPGFARAVEEASLETIESGTMTRDLIPLCEGVEPRPATSGEFLREVRARLAQKLGKAV